MVRFIYLSLISGYLLISCNSSAPKENNGEKGTKYTIHQDTATTVEKDAKSAIPADKQLTGWANFISGKSGGTYRFRDSAVWKRYQSRTAERWEVLQNKIGKKIDGWVSDIKFNGGGEPNTLFYPFAGGDFYYANLFFPSKDTTIMVGLEPCGSVFNPDEMQMEDLKTYLDNLGHTMFFPHQLGFFRTKSMEKDFDNNYLNGTLHTVAFYLTNLGYKIHYITHFNLDKNGLETGVVSAKKLNKNETRNSFKIGYSKSGGKVKEVVYFSYDASDGNMSRNTGLKNWLEKKGDFVTFFKAASYLMHYSSFSVVRNIVLKKSSRILQDDSGVPYKILKKNGFEVTLYGTFTKTIKLFHKEFQEDLKDAYANSDVTPLPFMIGYSVPLGECNLQMAVRKK